MDIFLIAAFCKKFGISNNGCIPWSISEDLSYFKKITSGHIVVMGRVTYFSIPKINRPLKNRFNIVITNNPKLYNDQEELMFVSLNEFHNLYNKLKWSPYVKLFVIGGEVIYHYFLKHYNPKKLYITQINNYFRCDKHFPQFTDYKLDSASQIKESKDVTFRYLIYKKNQKTHQEHVYLNLVKDILDHGSPREDRTGTGTISVFARQIRFDIQDEIPILTTKFVSWRAVLLELLWFIKGHTDSKILEKSGINIWKGNTSREFLDSRNLQYLSEGDIGEMYGFIWRHYGAEYKGCNFDCGDEGIDQLKRVIWMLKNEPFSRRIMMTTYDVKSLDKGVLEPCHGISLQFYVEKINDKMMLSASMLQRSNDTFLGFPINIVSYTVLIYIIAKLVDMHPKELIINTNDTHLYNNHLEQTKLQLTRKPYPFPKLVVSDAIKTKEIEQIEENDFDLQGYIYHPMIKAEMSI